MRKNYFIIIFLFFIVQFSFTQISNNSIILQKHNVYVDIMIPDGWNSFPNNYPSRNIVTTLHPLIRRGDHNDIPSITIVIHELNQSSDVEMNNLINRYNQTNLRNKFSVIDESNLKYKIFTSIGYNNYSSCLYFMYENYCIYLYSGTDSEDENKNFLIELINKIADNMNPRKMIKNNSYNNKQYLRRITNGNCCGRCSRPRVPENSSRAYALCAVFFHHIWGR